MPSTIASTPSAQDVTCPSCGARAGQPCRTKAGAMATGIHLGRKASRAQHLAEQEHAEAKAIKARRAARKAAEPSTEAAPTPEPKPTPSAAQPTKRQPKAKAEAAPVCPRKHTAQGAIDRCAAYYERNGHFRPSHLKADA